MAVLCENIGLLFVSVPKAASSAIASFLIEECGGESLLTRPIKNFLGMKILVDYRHMTVGQIVQYGLIDKDRLKALTVIGVVRNPFDYVVSEYFFLKKIYSRFGQGIRQRLLLGRAVYFLLSACIPFDTDTCYGQWIMPGLERLRCAATRTFEEFVALCYQGKRETFQRFFEGAEATILRFETVEDDLRKVLLPCGFKKPVRLQRVQVNTEKTKPYRAYYTPAARRIVEETFADDLQQFGYRF